MNFVRSSGDPWRRRCGFRMEAMKDRCRKRTGGRADRKRRLVPRIFSSRERCRTSHGALDDAALHMLLWSPVVAMTDRHRPHRRMAIWLRRARRHSERHEQHGDQEGQTGKQHLHPPIIRAQIRIIQIAMPIIIRFSVSETKPSGTLLAPPTHAHFSSRLSI